jgi:DNA polymerase-3 subunit epsilon
LNQLCDQLGYEFEHHDALEDAKAAGHVVISAVKKSGNSLSKWVGGSRA